MVGVFRKMTRCLAPCHITRGDRGVCQGVARVRQVVPGSARAGHEGTSVVAALCLGESHNENEGEAHPH